MQPNESTHGKKLRYIPPKVIQLEETQTGKGDCNNGSGDLGACDIGNSASGGCFAGNDGIIV